MLKKLSLVGAALISAAALAWFLWPRDVSPATATALEEAPVSPPLRESPAPVTAADPVVVERAVVEPAVPSKSPAPESPSRTWLLRGRVSGTPPERAAETRVSVGFLGPVNVGKRAESAVDVAGEFEVDLTECVAVFERYDGLPTELLAEGDHPACLRETVRVPFGEPQIEQAADGRELAVFRCELRMTTAAVVTGKVVVPADWSAPVDDGVAERPKVALWSAESELPTQIEPLDTADCDGQGRWTLRVNRSGLCVVLAGAHALRPATVRVELVLGRAVVVEPLALTYGASISGVVRMHDGAPAPAGTGVRATLSHQGRGPRFFASRRGDRETRLSWSESAFVCAEVSTVSSDDGSFRIDGLEEADYELEVSQLPNLRAAMGRRRSSELVVRAPASGIELGQMPAAIVVAVLVDGRAPKDEELNGVLLELTPRDSDLRGMELDLTNSQGHYGAIQVAPGIAFSLTPKKGPFARKTREIGPLESGQVLPITFDLHPSNTNGSLLLKLAGTDGSAVAGAQLGLYALDDDAREKALAESRMASDSGVFRWADLEPGRFWLRVRPGQFTQVQNDYLMGREVQVEVVSGKATEVEIPLEVGGRLRMGAKDADGGFVRAPVEARNERGEQIPTEFYCVTDTGVWGCGWYLCEQGLNDHVPLPAGRYEFTLTAEGFESQTVPVVLEAGKTTTIEVALRRK